MTRFAKLAATTALALVPFGAMAATPISTIDVDATLTGAADSNVLNYYPGIESDVAEAIAKRVELTGDAGDPEIRVEITRVSLDGDTFLPDSAEFNELEAIAVYTDENNEIPPLTLPIKVSARTGEGSNPDVIYVAPDRDDFYNAMLETLADSVAENVPEKIRTDVSR